MNMHTSFAPPGSPAAGPLPTSGRPEFEQVSASAMSMKWSALHDAVAVVGSLTGMAPETIRPEIRDFPAMLRNVGGWRCELAEQGIDDLSAVMEPGLAALLAIHARGVNPAPAAQALWQEFHVARAALLALTPPPEEAAPPRSM